MRTFREGLMSKSSIPDRPGNVCVCACPCVQMKEGKAAGVTLKGGDTITASHAVRNNHIHGRFIIRHICVSIAHPSHPRWPHSAPLHSHTSAFFKSWVIFTEVTPQTRSRSWPTHLFGPSPSSSPTSTRRRCLASPSIPRTRVSRESFPTLPRLAPYFTLSATLHRKLFPPSQSMIILARSRHRSCQGIAKPCSG
jgi:hypothetical protein